MSCRHVLSSAHLSEGGALCTTVSNTVPPTLDTCSELALIRNSQRVAVQLPTLSNLTSPRNSNLEFTRSSPYDLTTCYGAFGAPFVMARKSLVGGWRRLLAPVGLTIDMHGTSNCGPVVIFDGRGVLHLENPWRS